MTVIVMKDPLCCKSTQRVHCSTCKTRGCSCTMFSCKQKVMDFHPGCELCKSIACKTCYEQWLLCKRCGQKRSCKDNHEHKCGYCYSVICEECSIQCKTCHILFCLDCISIVHCEHCKLCKWYECEKCIDSPHIEHVTLCEANCKSRLDQCGAVCSHCMKFFCLPRQHLNKEGCGMVCSQCSKSVCCNCKDEHSKLCT